MAKKVLIADDEPNILISLEFLMQREGHASASRATATRHSRRSDATGRTSCSST